MSWAQKIPEFGTRTMGKNYALRSSAYVVMRDRNQNIAVVRTPVGIYLPGGGQEKGESAERNAMREVAEECGLQAQLGDVIGVADEYINDKATGNDIRIRSTFFKATLVGMTQATEPDHELIWMSQHDAEDKLAPGSHRWAIDEECRMRR